MLKSGRSWVHFARWQVAKDPGYVFAKDPATPNQTNSAAYARVGKYNTHV